MHKLVLTDEATGDQIIWTPTTEAEEVQLANALIGLDAPMITGKAVDARSDVA